MSSVTVVGVSPVADRVTLIGAPWPDTLAPARGAGIVTPGARLPSLSGNRLLYVDGLPIAVYAAGEVQFLEKLAPAQEWEARNAVLRRHVPAALASLDEP